MGDGQQSGVFCCEVLCFSVSNQVGAVAKQKNYAVFGDSGFLNGLGIGFFPNEFAFFRE